MSMAAWKKKIGLDWRGWIVDGINLESWNAPEWIIQDAETKPIDQPRFVEFAGWIFGKLIRFPELN